MFRGGGRIRSLFHDVASVANLLISWKEFRRGKNKKEDVRAFEFNLENNLFKLHEDLIAKNYKPDSYEAFFVHDPKRRHIHKASVRDRVLHQAVFRILYTIFDKYFIYHSYSSRVGKGTHKGVKSLYIAIRKISNNWKIPSYALKCDVRKFFDSIDHEILFALIKKKIKDEDTLDLVLVILKSFEKEKGKGLPLGNVTSQLFANIYLDELDQFVKHALKVKYYFRYADDFVILSTSKEQLEKTKWQMSEFLNESLRLELHKDKVFIRKVSQGIDFLGYVILPHSIVLRTKTKRRVLKKVNSQNISSYLGVLSHAKTNNLRHKILKIVNQK